MEKAPLCYDCKQTGRETKATRILNIKGKPSVCEEHYRQRMGIPAPASTRPVLRQAPRKSEEDMDKICKCGCGEKLRIDSTREYKMGHEPAGGGNTGKTVAVVRASKNGHFAVQLSAEGMDAVWSGLPADKKAELLGHL